MKIKNQLSLVILLTTAAYSLPNYASQLPPDALVSDSAFACLGMAERYSADGRRFDFAQTKAFISSQVDDCVSLLSWSRHAPNKAREVKEKMESEWNRTHFEVSEDQYNFYSTFHRQIMNGINESVSNAQFLKEMTNSGKELSLSMRKN